MMTLRRVRRNDAGSGARLEMLLLAIVVACSVACAQLNVGAAPAAGIPLRVMTYNIRSGNGDLGGTAAAIRAQRPDIVALQEVDVHWSTRSDFADEATEIGRRLDMQVRFAPIYVIPDSDATKPAREFGVALLSRYPVRALRNDTITRLSTQAENPVPVPMPGLLDATLDVHGNMIHVLDTHLDYRRDPGVRATQAREMIAHVDTAVPTLVFGDMNASPGAPELQPLLTLLHDAWPAANGSGFTYPAEAPTERIDYVLISSHFRVRGASVPVTEASDHRPVVVDLLLLPATPR